MKITRLIAVVALFISSLMLVSAQGLPAYTPPTLAMIVLLDDTRTMTVETSAKAAGETVFAGGTDPDDTRAEAVRQIAMLLHADQARTHQLGVYSFGANTGQWLTGTAGNRFASLGGENGDNLVNLQALSRALGNRGQETQRGGGDLTAAVNEASEILAQQFAGRSSPAKIVVVMITDDVPILDFSTASPWSVGLEHWKSADARNFQTAVSNLRTSMPPYESSTCRHTGGSAVFAVFPMGAANWVNGDGSLHLAPNDETYGTFYTEIASANGWLTLEDDHKPLVYPIAPGFGNTAQLREEFLSKVGSFMEEIRCTWAEPVENLSSLDRPVREFEVEMSNLYPFARLMIQSDGQMPVEIFDASRDSDSGAIAGTAPGVRVYDEELSDLQVWSFARDQYTGAWAGTWRVEAGPGARVIVERDIRSEEISWTPLNATDVYPEARDIAYNVRVAAGEQSVSQSNTFTLVLRVRNTANDEIVEYPFEPDGDAYRVTIPASEMTGRTYEVQPVITFRHGWTGSISQAQSYPLGAETVISIERQVGMEVLSPGANSVWCLSDEQEFRVRLNWSADVHRNADPASLYSYAQVNLYYTPPPPLNAQTPTPDAPIVMQMRPDPGDPQTAEDDTFEFVVNCETELMRGDQVMVVRAMLADQATYEYEWQGEYVATIATATSTPSPTPTPTATRAILTPMPLPTQPSVDILGGVVRPLGEPPLRETLLLILVGTVVGFGVNRIGRFRRTALPLTFITIESRRDSTPQPLLTGISRLLPFAQRRTIYSAADETLFTVNRDANGAYTFVPEPVSSTLGNRSVQVFYYDRPPTLGKSPVGGHLQTDQFFAVDHKKETLLDVNRWDYCVAAYPFLPSTYFRVWRVDRQTRQPTDWRERIKALRPCASTYQILKPGHHLTPLFTVAWSSADQAIRVEAAQQLRVNGFEIDARSAETSHDWETLIEVDGNTYRLYNRLAR